MAHGPPATATTTSYASKRDGDQHHEHTDSNAVLLVFLLPLISSLIHPLYYSLLGTPKSTIWLQFRSRTWKSKTSIQNKHITAIEHYRDYIRDLPGRLLLFKAYPPPLTFLIHFLASSHCS